MKIYIFEEKRGESGEATWKNAGENVFSPPKLKENGTTRFSPSTRE